LWAAFAVAFVVPVLVVLPLGSATLGNPPFAIAATALILVFGCIVTAFVATAHRNASGNFDLVINRINGYMTLPQTNGRKQCLSIPMRDLVAIRIDARVKTDNEGCRIWIYSVMAEWNDADRGLQDAKLAEGSTEQYAKALAALIREKAGIAQPMA
jgi:hypothetical protein